MRATGLPGHHEPPYWQRFAWVDVDSDAPGLSSAAGSLAVGCRSRWLSTLSAAACDGQSTGHTRAHTHHRAPFQPAQQSPAYPPHRAGRLDCRRDGCGRGLSHGGERAGPPPHVRLSALLPPSSCVLEPDTACVGVACVVRPASGYCTRAARMTPLAACRRPLGCRRCGLSLTINQYLTPHRERAQWCRDLGLSRVDTHLGRVNTHLGRGSIG